MRARTRDTLQPIRRNSQRALQAVLSGNRPSYPDLLKLTNADLGDLLRRGADMAELGQPPSASTQPCLDEVRVTAYFYDLNEAGADQAGQVVSRQQQIIEAAAIKRDEMSVDRFVGRLRDEAQIALTEIKLKLDPLVTKRNEKSRQLRKMQVLENGSGSSSYAKSAWPAAGLLSLCIGAEAAMNAPIFADGDALGAVGGWPLALAASAINVGVGSAIAFGRRELRRPSQASRFMGASQIAIATVFGVSMALLAAHYRHAIMTDPSTAMTAAWDTIRVNFLPPSVDIKTGSLMGMSVIGGVAAYYETMKTYGQYPGYRSRAIELEDADRALNRFRLNAADELREMRADAQREIDDHRKAMKLRLEQARRAKGEAQLAIGKYYDWIQLVGGAHKTALTSFWQGNSAVRSDASPDHFGTIPDLDPPQLKLDERIEELVNQIEEAFEVVARRVQEALEEIEQIIRNALMEIGILGASINRALGHEPPPAGAT